MNNLIKLSKFKPEYTDFIFDQIAQFRTEKDEKLLTQIDPYDENNLEKVSFDSVLDPGKKFSNRFYLGKYINDFALDSNQKTPKFFRIYNEIPTIILIVVIFVVIFKPL